MGAGIELPSTDDRHVWDAWLASLWFPCMTAADELRIFDALSKEPATAAGLAARTGFSERALGTVLPMLTSLHFLTRQAGRYSLSDTARLYLLPDSPFYWGPLIRRFRASSPLHDTLKNLIAHAAPPRNTHPGESNRPSDAWAAGEIDLERARGIAAFMHSHSVPASLGAARNLDYRGVKRLLDVGGGSGIFSISFAQHAPALRCTVMELKSMCQVAEEYIKAAGVQERVDTRAVDMFRQPWPEGYDAMFFSNIFHDWSDETCLELARKAHAALPPGGRIFLHEMLLDDSGANPRTTAAFSVLMLLGTEGRQFMFQELKELLEKAGFSNVGVTHTYSYYSVVHATK